MSQVKSEIVVKGAAYRVFLPFFMIFICSTMGPGIWYKITEVTLADGSSPIPLSAGYFVFAAALAFAFCSARLIKGDKPLVFTTSLALFEFVILILAGVYTGIVASN
jgi:hypothetical protein